MSIEFQDNSEVIKAMMQELCLIAVAEAGIEMLEQTQQNTKVKTGRTKGSWKLETKENGEGASAYIGSNFENAIWEEFGTGEYALHGDGRKGGWYYEDEQGNGHFTHGKKPRRALHNAFISKRNTCERIIREKLGDLGK